MKQNLVGESYTYVLKNVKKTFRLIFAGFVCNALAHVEKSRLVPAWYKAIRDPARFSFGLTLLPTRNVYYLE